MYLVIKASEGESGLYFTDDISKFLNDPGDYGIERFFDSIPEEKDPNYWARGEALLLEVTVLKPRPVTPKYTLEKRRD